MNYGDGLGYGVLLDIGSAGFEGGPIDLRMAFVNVIWQGDANSVCLRSFAHCQSPHLILNLTGPETLRVRHLAEEFARRFGVQPIFHSEEMPTALLSNAARAHQTFVHPSVTVSEIIDWTATWISSGGPCLDKPTHFEVRDGKF